MKNLFVKRGILGVTLAMFLFAGFSGTAHASTISELAALVRSLNKQVVELKAQMQASVLRSTSSTTAVDPTVSDSTNEDEASVNSSASVTSTDGGATSTTASTSTQTSDTTTDSNTSTSSTISTSSNNTTTSTTTVGSASNTNSTNVTTTTPGVPTSTTTSTEPIRNTSSTASSTVVAVNPVTTSTIAPAKYGSAGANVLAIQNILASQGYLDESSVTGYFGPKTRVAVLAFQSANGLALVGSVGPMTATKLSNSGTTSGNTSGTERDTGATVPMGKPSGCILPAGKTAWIRVVSPNGGEKYMPGDTLKVTWASCGVSATNVSISFFPTNSSGVALGPIVSFTTSTPNDGSEQFTLATNSAVGFYKARVKAIGGTETDISDSPYEIIDSKVVLIAGSNSNSMTYTNDVWASRGQLTNWTQNLANTSTPGSNQFEQRTGIGAAYLNGKIYVVWGESDTAFSYEDVWSSSDEGKTWTKIVSKAPWARRGVPGFVSFNGKLWLVGGGYLSGGQDDVWSSSDGINWTQVTSSIPWGPRYGHSTVVFQNKLWVIGGYKYGSGGGMMADMWSSPDGVTWTQVTAAAPWGNRLAHSSTVFQNKIWILGGPALPSSLSDVWSFDGVSYNKTAQGSVPWKDNQWGELIAHGNKLWLIAGDNRGSSGLYSSKEIWSSIDGATWSLVTNSPGWTGRMGHAVVVIPL